MSRAKKKDSMKANLGPVLVVASKPEVAATLAVRLRGEGCQVQIVPNPKQGCEAARRSKFDTIVFCGGEVKPAADKVVRAAGGRSAGVQVVHVEAQDLAELDSGQVTVLDELLLRQELRETNKQLLQYLIEIGEAASFVEAISGIAHEINNPLAAVLGYAQLALTATSREKLDGYMQTINRQAARCQAITQKLSSVARRYRPRKKIADLNKIIEKVVSLFASHLATHHIEVKLGLLPDPLPVRVDLRQIQQVFVNLVTNAKEAMAENRTGGTLRITSRRSKREAVVTVSDNGPGIPPNIRKKVFRPFFSTKPDRPGLGLSISRSVLTASGGDIEIVEKAKAGATVRIRLPLVKHDVSQDDTERIHNDQEQEFPSGKRILVIDDEKPLAKLVSQILRRGGEKVDVVFTPAQSYKRIHGKDYDMILMDIRMPEEDSEDIFHCIKEINPEAVENVVFCTEDRLDEEVQRLFSGLDDRMVEKPFSVGRVYAVARRAP